MAEAATDLNAVSVRCREQLVPVGQRKAAYPPVGEATWGGAARRMGARGHVRPGAECAAGGGSRCVMLGYEDHGMGWWVIFPIIFMVFMMIMMFRMMGRGGPMGMMGGGHRHDANDEDRALRRSQGDRVNSQETPLEIAQRRYASGELSREEFQRIRDDLE